MDALISTDLCGLLCVQLEAAIQGVWVEVLGLAEPPSVTSDFFAVGGSSLKAGQLGTALLAGEQLQTAMGVSACLAVLSCTNLLLRHINVFEWCCVLRALLQA